jgi:FOG: WD40 repeat
MKKVASIIVFSLFLLSVTAYAQTLQVTLSPDKSKVDRSTKNGTATIFFDSNIEDLSIVCTDENPDEPIAKINDNLWFTHIDVKKDVETDGICYRNYLLKSGASTEYYLTTDTIAPNQVLYYTVALPNELEPILQEEKARNIAAKAEKLADQGNVFAAQLLALQALPPDYPLIPEIEAALRRVKQSLILKGHQGFIRSAVFSPNGKYIISAAWDRTVRIWDSQTGKELRQIILPPMPNYATFSPDGKKILAAADSIIYVFDAQSEKDPLILKGHSGGVDYASFSPDGEIIVSASRDNTARIWDARTGKSLHILEGHTHSLYSAVFNPDGRRVVTTSLDNTRIWDVKTGKEVLQLSSISKGGRNAVYDKSGLRIAVASDYGAIIFDAYTGFDLLWLGQQDNYRAGAIAFSPDGTHIATATERTDGHSVCLWDALTGKKLACLEGRSEGFASVAFSPDGQQIALTEGIYRDSREDNCIYVWDIRKGESFVSLKGPSEKDDPVRLWDARNGNILKNLKGHRGNIYSTSFSPDGKKIVSVVSDSTIRIWDAKNGNVLMTLKEHTSSIYFATFSPDGKKIVSSSRDNTARVWDVQTGKTLHILEGHTRDIHYGVFSPDGKQIITASWDDTIRRWDAKTGLCIQTLKGHERGVTYVSYNSNGEEIVSASSDRTIRIWDSKTGKTIRVLKGHTDFVNSANFSPDNKYIVSGSDDETVRVWDAKTGKTLQVLEGTNDRVTFAAFSSNGEKIISGSYSGTIRIWDFPPLQKLIKQIQEYFKNQPLTKEEKIKYGME